MAHQWIGDLAASLISMRESICPKNEVDEEPVVGLGSTRSHGQAAPNQGAIQLEGVRHARGSLHMP